MKNLKKMSLNLATKELSRKELKCIMAGSGSNCKENANCSVYVNGYTHSGNCKGSYGNNVATCYCLTMYGQYVPTSNGGMSRCWN